MNASHYVVSYSILFVWSFPLFLLFLGCGLYYVNNRLGILFGKNTFYISHFVFVDGLHTFAEDRFCLTPFVEYSIHSHFGYPL